MNRVGHLLLLLLGMLEDGLAGLGQLAAERQGHVAGNGLGGRLGDGQEIGQFGQGGFGGHVQTGDDAGSRQDAPRGVQRMDTAGQALGDIDDDDAALDGIGQDLGHGIILRGIAGAKGLQHESSESRQPQHGVDHLRLDAGKHAQTGDTGGVQMVGTHPEASDVRGRPSSHDGRPVDLGARRGGDGQRGEIGGVEGGKVTGGGFGGAVASKQAMVEEQTHLGDHKVSCDH